MMTKKKKITCFAVGIPLVIVVALTAGFFIYTGNYYHASQEALDCLKSDNEIDYSLKDGNYIFAPKKETNKGLIFYPGALVEDDAYAPLANLLAHKGIYSVICHMNFHLAFFSSDAATKPIQENPNISFYIGGHSLGGAIASSYASKNANNLEGVVYLASYSDVDLTSTSLKTLSIYGSNDGVINKENYEKYKTNMPRLEEHIILGGNHCQFGSYGFQNGDKEATISGSEQIALTANYIADFIL